jgi:hypothetical protein
MYKDVRSQMGQFDLISFSGKGTVSNIIKAGTNSDISHVAMVYRIFDETDRVLIIESTSLVEIEDAVHGELIKGVQIQYLSNRVDSYEGQIYWHKLRTSISEARQAAMYAWLTTQHLKRIKYDPVGAVRSGIDIFDYILESKPDYEKLFCSEMVAKAYEIAGLYIGNPSEQTPDDVISYPFLKQRVQIK